MATKVLLLADPGIDGAFALSLALLDPTLEVLGIGATAGNVAAEQATRNVQIVLAQLDPPRRPRIGAALPIFYEADGTRLHGPGGLGGTQFPCAELHNLPESDKLLVDLVRQHPHECTLVVLGPLTTVWQACKRDPDFPHLVRRLICVGGTWHEPGNHGPISEFHFACDPDATRFVLRAGMPTLVLPLDVTRKLVLSPSALLGLPDDTTACRFLRQIVPFGIGATSHLYGIEGFHLKDVLGIIAVALPSALTTRSVVADIEVRGEITRGMLVIDQRKLPSVEPNLEIAVNLDVPAIRGYIDKHLLSGREL